MEKQTTVEQEPIKKVSTWERLCQEKRQRIKESNLDSLEYEFKKPNYYIEKFSKEKESRLYFGDYGNVISSTSDYEYNLIFRSLGIDCKVADLRLWSENDKGAEERKYNLVSSDDETCLEIDFFSSKSNVNFSCWIDGLSEDKKKGVIVAFENTFDGRLSRQILEDIDNDIVNNDYERVVDVSAVNDEDVNYFIERHGLLMRKIGLNWDREKTEKGSFLKFKVVEEVLDGSFDKRQFLMTDVAKEMLDTLDSAGLSLSTRMLGCVMEDRRMGHEKRYGNGYADMFRQLGYLFDSKHDDDKAEEIFDNFDRDRQFKLTRILRDTSREMSKSCRMWLTMASELIDSGDKDINRVVGYEYYKSGLGLKGNGACEDGEFYTVTDNEWTTGDENFWYFYNRGGDYKVTNDFHMAMTRKEIEVNGVILPRGYFCRVSDEEVPRVEPIRLSMFGVPEGEVAEVFGYQYDKAVDNGVNFKKGREIIGTV